MANEKFGKWNISEEKLLKDIENAAERGKRKAQQEPRAELARYDDQSKMVFVYLTNGSMFGFPASSIKELASALPHEIAQVTVTELGDALHWDDLDAHYTLYGLLNGVFGSKTWMKELGRKGGSVTSDVKVLAARANGMKGGRPKKMVYQFRGACFYPSFEYGIEVFNKDTISSNIKASGCLNANEIDEEFEYIFGSLDKRDSSFIKTEFAPFRKQFKELSIQELALKG